MAAGMKEGASSVKVVLKDDDRENTDCLVLSLGPLGSGSSQVLAAEFSCIGFGASQLINSKRQFGNELTFMENQGPRAWS